MNKYERVILAIGTYLALLACAYVAGATLEDCGVEGADWYWECVTGEELDLTPVEDEAQTLVSHGRN